MLQIEAVGIVRAATADLAHRLGTTNVGARAGPGSAAGTPLADGDEHRQSVVHDALSQDDYATVESLRRAGLGYRTPHFEPVR